jgi:hypothetical protein
MNRTESRAQGTLTRHALAAAHHYWQLGCRPPHPKTIKAECANTQPLVILNTLKPNVIHLPHTAQCELETIKKNLISSVFAGRIRVDFVQWAIRNWPELRNA